MHDSFPDFISLDVEHLTGSPRPDLPVGVYDLSFTVQPGMAVEMTVPPSLVEWFPDVLTGLLKPESGHVQLKGRNKNDLMSHNEGNLLAGIRRVFSGTAWISNLTLLENILLPAEWNYPGSMPALMEEITRMADQAGLSHIPPVRPHQAAEHILWDCQWIRAMLGNPLILLVEQSRDNRFKLPAFAVPRMNACLERGGVVLWINAMEAGALPTLSVNWTSIPVATSRKKGG